MVFKSAIVDECGIIKKWCCDMTIDEIADCLSKHPEWDIDCVEVI